MDPGLLWVLLLAAVPFVEIFFAIPFGVALRLDPVAVTLAALIGNFLPLPVLALLQQRLARRWPRLLGGLPLRPQSRRGERVRQALHRWGIPGLALQAPFVTGTHIAVPVALALGADQRRTLTWMAIALALWSPVITMVAVIGIEGIRRLLGW